MIPIVIRKDPDRYEHLMNQIHPIHYAQIIDNVDLMDIVKFIMDINNQSWVPNCYWKNIGKDISEPFFVGEIEWVIYSYLTIRGLLVIEDRYFGYNQSRTEKILHRSDYFNPLEQPLYIPIIKRLEKEGYIEGMPDRYYKIGKRFLREEKLKELDI